MPSRFGFALTCGWAFMAGVMIYMLAAPLIGMPHTADMVEDPPMNLMLLFVAVANGFLSWRLP